MENTGIEKLTNENYDSWKLDVELLLVKQKLWKYVSPGVRPAPTANGANAAELAAWDEGDQQARATIGLLMTRSQHGLIRNTTSAKAVWENAKKKHEKKTLTTKAYLIKRVCDQKFHDGGDIGGHLQEFEDLFEKLSNVGIKFEEELQVIFILRSLPSSYNALTTALENRSADELTVDLVKGSIINEVEKRNEFSSSDPVVLKTEGLSNIQCNYCHKFGHKWRKCRQLEVKMEGESARSPKEAGRESKKVSKSHAKAKVENFENDSFAFGVS